MSSVDRTLRGHLNAVKEATPGHLAAAAAAGFLYLRGWLAEARIITSLCDTVVYICPA